MTFESQPLSPPSDGLSALITAGFFVGSLWILGSVAYALFLSPLRRIPGPPLARFTRLWELWALRQGRYNERLISLHRQHGPVVRLAPNRFSFDRAADMKKIYSISGSFEKANFYHSWSDPKRENLLSIQDEKRHAQQRRPIAQLYTMTAVLSYEEAVDKMSAVFTEKLGALVHSKETFALPRFCQLYAFDVIGQITMDTDFGMMESNGDTTGVLKTVERFTNYAVQMGMVPELHRPVFALLMFIQPPFARVLTNVINSTIDKFRKRTRGGQSSFEPFLSKLLALEEKGKVDELSMMNVVGANINAGSDTTGVTLSATFYHLYRNPDKLRKLRDEIDAFARDGRASDPVTFAEAQAMPYLQAVVKEVLRMHPAVSVILPRTVPKGGVELGGHFFPAKAEVGCSAWPLHYNPQEVDRPREFRPERWLETEHEAASRSSQAVNFAFGAGSRTCLGKNISLLEISKLVPQVVRSFDVQIHGASDSMETDAGWFVWPRYTCRVESRSQARSRDVGVEDM
ncbi:hypothetical protein CDD83_312 [Cordyceps sp. RAO-2017]|nr:hypothetical protein CDD83_312 [Cordyceps sp. RAO-2017]